MNEDVSPIFKKKMADFPASHVSFQDTIVFHVHFSSQIQHMKTEPLKPRNLDEAGNRESRETGDELFTSPGDFKGRSPFSNL